MDSVKDLVNPPKSTSQAQRVAPAGDFDTEDDSLPKLATKFEVSQDDLWKIPLLKTDECNAGNTGRLEATIPPGWVLSQKFDKRNIEDFTVIIDRYRNRLGEFVLKGVKCHKFKLACGGGGGAPSVVVGAGRPLLEKEKTKYQFNLDEMNQLVNIFRAIKTLCYEFRFEPNSMFQKAVDYQTFIYEMHDMKLDIDPEHTARFMEKNVNLAVSPLILFPSAKKLIVEWVKWERRQLKKKYVAMPEEDEDYKMMDDMMPPRRKRPNFQEGDKTTDTKPATSPRESIADADSSPVRQGDQKEYNSDDDSEAEDNKST